MALSPSANKPNHRTPSTLTFLDLPVEIRLDIFEYVLGDRIVHVTACSVPRVCHFPCPQEAVDSHAEANAKRWTIPNTQPIVNITQYRSRHPRQCKILTCWMTELDLGILMVNGQFYREVSDVLWARKTFAMEAYTLKLFLQRLSQSQRKAVTHLHITLGTRHWTKDWVLAITAGKLLETLSGLRTLRICLIAPSETMMAWNDFGRFLESVLASRSLRLREVSIVVNEDDGVGVEENDGVWLRGEKVGDGRGDDVVEEAREAVVRAFSRTRGGHGNSFRGEGKGRLFGC